MSAVAIPPIPVIRASDPESVALAEEAVGEIRRGLPEATVVTYPDVDPESGRERIMIEVGVTDEEYGTYREIRSDWIRNHDLIARLRLAFLVVTR